MKIGIRVVRRETQRALQVILSQHPYRIHWLPKSQIMKELHAGDRDIEIDVPEWLIVRLEKEVNS